jgi:hypothetical protein
VNQDYVVAFYTHGSFHGWATDPVTLEDAEAFVADPPEEWMPRPQDSLEIFYLERVHQ